MLFTTPPAVRPLSAVAPRLAICVSCSAAVEKMITRKAFCCAVLFWKPST